MVHIHYGSKILELDIPQENLTFNLQTHKISRDHDETEEIKRSLKNPSGSKRLREMVPKNASVVILGDDRTRLTPQHRIIPPVLEELYAAGLKKDRIKIIIAYGTHRPMTQEEIVTKYGREVVSDIEILHHDCLNGDNLADKGVTRRGTRIFVNKACMQADFRIGIGSVIPHYPTGWSGGAKILLPGVAGEDTTYSMHLLGITKQALGLETSPVREEMEDFATEVGLHYIVNVIHDSKGHILQSFAGHFITAHREAVRFGKKVYGAEFHEPADITLSSTYPVDFDLTQSSKGLFSAAVATKNGGEIILVSPCCEGVAPTHGEEMVRLARYDDDAIRSMLRRKTVNDPLAATECMYYNSIKNTYRTSLMMDEEISVKLGFSYMSPDYLPAYIEQRLKDDRSLKIGILNQSTEILPMRVPQF